jgi:hypothetical protein
VQTDPVSEVVEMPVDEVEAAALAGHLGEIVGAAHGAPVLVLSGPAPADMGPLTSALSLLPCVVVARPGDTALRPFVDVVPGDDDREAVVDAALRHPLAATSLVLLLRGGERRTVEEGLVAESTTYSMLQASPEFARWRRSRPVRHRRRSGSPLRVERDGDDLVITLQRQEVHNAYDMAMRDALVDALRLVAVDPAVRVVLRADGPSFCSGGDLDEFGLRPDPATAHTVRLARSAAYLLSRVASRVSVEVHGACYGSGVELAAFAGRVVAHPDTRFALPEIDLGLIPGAGGTVSLPRRIGRHRTALLALTGTAIDAQTALAWGLVDVLSER